MPELDDTQPHSPRRAKQPASSTQEAAAYSPDDDLEPGGPGCLVWSLVLLVVAVFAVVIVIFAALAGWSSGQQVVRAGATATQERFNAEQCARLESEVRSGNTVLLQVRMESLLTQTPPVPCVIPYIPTATALYFEVLPTATDTPTATATLTPTTDVTATPTTEVVATTDSAFNTESLLQEAQAYIQSNAWEDAISTLDAIISIDPTFRPAVVEDLLYRALTERALQLYRNGENLARAIVLTDRAEAIRPVGELGFERTVAQLWLDAQRALNINFPEAIRLLRQVVQFSPDYMNGEAGRQLYRQTIAYADALAAGNEPCMAVVQYDAAIALRGADAETTGKRNTAQTACLQLTTAPGVVTTQEVGQPTADSGGAPPTATIAPVGQQ